MADPDVHKVLLAGIRAGSSRTPEEVLASDIKLAKVACVGWSDNWSLDGEKLAYSKANVERVFSIPPIRKALLGAIAQDRLFMNGA